MIDASVPAGLCLALFKGTRPGMDGVYNRIGRYLDRGPYSHCEMVFSDRISASASYIDGGVRVKNIGYSSFGNWDFLPIPDPKGDVERMAWRWFKEKRGLPYDVWGNIRFATNFARDSPDKWFCSEACMAALGFAEAFRYGPSGGAVLTEYVFRTKIVGINK